jgi:hypothetical protein
MSNKEKLYIAQEDLFRFGSGTSSRISNVKPREVDTIHINGVEVVVANGGGVSLYNREGLDKCALTGWVWEIRAGTYFPIGLKLIKDDDPLGHYTLAPTYNMPLSQYIGLLEQVAIRCQKLFRKKA